MDSKKSPIKTYQSVCVVRSERLPQLEKTIILEFAWREFPSRKVVMKNLVQHIKNINWNVGALNYQIGYPVDVTGWE